MKYVNHIRVWSWDNAPSELRELSTHGGDEDWVALVPPIYENNYMGWMESGSSFGYCDVYEYEHPELPGYKIRIGAHA